MTIAEKIVELVESNSTDKYIQLKVIQSLLDERYAKPIDECLELAHEIVPDFSGTNEIHLELISKLEAMKEQR